MQAGEIGQLLLGRARYGWSGPWWGEWFYQPGGGALFDLGVYNLTALCGFFGSVKRVTAMVGTAIPERMVEGEADEGRGRRQRARAARLRRRAGSRRSRPGSRCRSTALPRSSCTAPRACCRCWATTGRRRDSSSGATPAAPGRSSRSPTRSGRGPTGCATWSTAADRGLPTVTRPEHAYHALEVMLAAKRSAEEGRVISIESEFPALDYSAWRLLGRRRPPQARPEVELNGGEPAGVPSRLRVGDRDRGVPDRGRMERRRPRSRASGTTTATCPATSWAATPATWPATTTRRCGRGPRPDGQARPAGVPVLGGLAARDADGVGAGQPAGPGLLRPARRRPAGARDRAARDALPLGPALGAAARARRLDGRGVRRSCSATTPRWSVQRLGDRVASFGTLNEPYCSAFLGHARRKSTRRGGPTRPSAYAAAHHLNLAHGLAASALRSVAPRAKVSVSLNLAQVYPATDSDEDREAAAHVDMIANRIFLEPMLRGRYPDGAHGGDSRAGRLVDRPRRRPRPDPPAARRARRELLLAEPDRRRPLTDPPTGRTSPSGRWVNDPARADDAGDRRGPAPTGRGRCRSPGRTPRWGGGSSRRRSPTSWCASVVTTPRSRSW